MKWREQQRTCCPDVDWTAVTGTIQARRGFTQPNGEVFRRTVGAQMVLHGRGEERFWHWSDQVGRLRHAAEWSNGSSAAS